MKIIPQIGAHRGDGDAGGESAKVEIGMAGVSEREDEQPERKGKHWLVFFFDREEAALFQTTTNPGNDHADGDSGGELDAERAQFYRRVADERHQREHDRQREPVVQSALDIEQITQARRDFFAPDNCSGENGIGRTENGADQKRGSPGDPGDVMGQCCSAEHR